MKPNKLATLACTVSIVIQLLVTAVWAADTRAKSKVEGDKAIAQLRDLVSQLSLHPFDPKCGDDPACAVWAEFRLWHPFPYQAFIAKSTPEALYLIISEPGPSLDRATLESLIRKAMGSDLVKLERRRWFIGVDGWLEDLVITMRPIPPVNGNRASTSPVPNAIFRDRVAMLHVALYGTAYGAAIESSEPPTERVPVHLDLRVTPVEINAWVTDPKLAWRPLSNRDTVAATMAALRGKRATGAFKSLDGTLVLLLVPSSALAPDAAGDDARSSLRADFRRFAVASDLVLAGLSFKNGDVGVLARNRQIPMAALPPLRFETFESLARSAHQPRLSQSYERTALFAGRAYSGENRYRDWAPIYLSEALRDTEFGALLNITDQMLKGWSEAGHTSYLYFDYPYAPEDGDYTFGGEALSDIVRKRTGAASVLFNWNTSGLTTSSEYPAHAILVANRTGALPVTYGSEISADDGMKTGEELADLEEQAYDYFAEVQDPNLARVVQYTQIYQTMCAAAQRVGKPATVPATISEAHARWREVMASQASSLLDQIDDGHLAPRAGDLTSAELGEWRDLLRDSGERPLAEFREKHPELKGKNGDLAMLLVDPRTEQEKAMAGVEQLEKDLPRLAKALETLKADNEGLDGRARALAARVMSWAEQHPIRLTGPDDTRLPKPFRDAYAQLKRDRASIDRRAAYLSERARALRYYKEKALLFRDAATLSAKLHEIIPISRDLGAIESLHLKAYSAAPDGSIKTPSMVVSWDTNMAKEGGHDLDSRVLKIERDASVPDIAIVDEAGQTRLKVNPSRFDAVSSRASEIARMLEHRQERDPRVLRDLIATPPARPRTRNVALEIPESSGRRLDRDDATDVAVAEGDQPELLAELSSKIETGRYDIVAKRDADGFRVIAERNTRPPPKFVYRKFRDTPSLHEYLAGLIAKRKSGRALFVGDGPGAIGAMMNNVGMREWSPPELDHWAEDLGGAKPASMYYVDLKNRRRSATIHVIDSREPGTRPELQDFDLMHRETDWTSAPLAPVDLSGEGKLSQLGPWPVGVDPWEPERDGQPYGVELTFSTVKGARESAHATIIAGVATTDNPAGWLASLISRLQKRHSQAKSSILEGITDIKEMVERQSKTVGGIKRILVYVREARTRYLITDHGVMVVRG